MDVRRIEWTFHTSSAAQWSHSPVSVEYPLPERHPARLCLQEPGNTPRLSRAEIGTYLVDLSEPSGIGVAGLRRDPDRSPSPTDLQGTSKSFYRSLETTFGEYMIRDSVVEGRMEFCPGTIDSWRWMETPHRLTFPGED